MANDTRLPAGDQDGDWMGAIEQTQRDGVAEEKKPKAQQVWPTWGTPADARTVSLDQPLPVQLPTIARGAGAADAQTLRTVAASNSPEVAALAAIDADIGAPDTTAAPADGVGNYSVNGALKRALLNWAALLARIPALAVTGVPLLSGVIATGAGSAVADSGRPPTFTGRVAGPGAVAATVAIEVRNDPAGVWVLAGTLTMSGTTTAGDGFAMAARYLQYRANVIAISGTSAAVTVTMGG